MLGIFAFLFVTVGLASQLAGVFQGLMFDARKHLREGSALERSAQAVSIGVYALLWLPFWLIQLPFSFLGSLWSSHRVAPLVAVAVLLAMIDVVAFYSPHILRLLQSF